jgi:alpha-galactosidase
MKTLLLAFFSLASCWAADLTGNWLYVEHRSDGTEQRTYFNLSDQGGKITGEVHSNQFRFIVLDSSGTPDGFTLKVGPKDGATRRVREYQGKLVGDELHLTAIRTPGHEQPEMIAHLVPASEGALAAAIPPPALHDVPYNNLAKTPPMGWNSWNKFAGKVDDAGVRAAAEAIAGNGMKEVGYLYVNIDDTWQGDRDSAGNIRANRKFPDMKGLTDYIHSKGLKAGLYSSPGPSTCAGYEGSYGHEEQDARTYAAWGFDYLKYDWCSAGTIYKDEDMQAVYQKMGDALEASGRAIVYSLCQYGRADVWKWGPKVSGNLWRTTGDISDNWGSMTKIGFNQDALAPYAAPGHWNDPDMLEIGNGGMSNVEYQVHMTLWSLLAAPLLAGNDLQHMSAETRAILTNRDVIAIDQDPLGKQATRASKSGDQEVWIKDLSGGAKAIALFNRAAEPAKVTVKWSDLGPSATPHQAQDLWLHRDVKLDGPDFSAQVPGHGVVLLRLSE